MSSSLNSAVAWVALCAGLAGVGLALTNRPAAEDEVFEDDMSDLMDPASLENRLNDAEGRLGTVQERLGAAEARLAELDAIARQAAGEASEARELARGAASGEPTVVTGAIEPVPTDDAGRKAALADLLARLRAGDFGDQGTFALLSRARDLGGLDAALKAMETWAEGRGGDADAMVALAEAYAVKLLDVPTGPLRGQWAMKAIGALDRALEADPQHWDARFQKAFNLSQWPAFTGKQGEAITEFEKLLEIQEGQPQEPRHSQTYFQLGNTYRDAGNVEKALEVFRRGAQRFPDDANLKEQVRLLEKQ